MRQEMSDMMDHFRGLMRVEAQKLEEELDTPREKGFWLVYISDGYSRESDSVHYSKLTLATSRKEAVANFKDDEREYDAIPMVLE